MEGRSLSGWCATYRWKMFQNTLPEASIALETRPSQKSTVDFQVLCYFQGGCKFCIFESEVQKKQATI